MSTSRRANQQFDWTISERTLQELVDTIVQEIDPEQIILFGSRARGDARPDSDLDLIVIEKEPYGKGRSRRLRTGALYQALMRWQVPKDILLYSQAEVEFWRNSLNNVLARALREGRVLYARP